ncbi:MAG: hypothetical protein R2854_14065 [Caldilineaceae bacterium]
MDVRRNCGPLRFRNPQRCWTTCWQQGIGGWRSWPGPTAYFSAEGAGAFRREWQHWE